MNIPRSTFYKRPDAACETARERTDADLRVRIEDILAEFRSSPDLCVKAEEAPRLRLGCLGDLLFLEE